MNRAYSGLLKGVVMKFYINKFPVKYVVSTEGKAMDPIPEGTAFKVSGINYNMIDLMPVKDINCNPIGVDCAMLQFGFTESEYINS